MIFNACLYGVSDGVGRATSILPFNTSHSKRVGRMP
jgi:hypothetical protein